jgi:hypothetical protein
MNRIDFEPSNAYMLKTKMLDGGTPNRFDKKRLIPKKKKKQTPPPRTLSVDGDNDKYSENGKNYPVNMDKKIFGMRPKTLAIALGVIVGSIIILNMSGKGNQVEAVNNGGVQ